MAMSTMYLRLSVSQVRLAYLEFLPRHYYPPFILPARLSYALARPHPQRIILLVLAEPLRNRPPFARTERNMYGPVRIVEVYKRSAGAFDIRGVLECPFLLACDADKGVRFAVR
jgi:hypothetical protein